MAEVLFVSKPVTPPWNDSSKNLARDIAGHLERHRPVLMGREGQPNPLDRGRVEPVYPASADGRFSLGPHAAWRVFRRLLLGPRVDLWHFFFAPNRKSSAAGRLATAARKAPSVHTACSAPPEGARWRDLLFADVTVALSRASYERFRREGVPESRLRWIPPCVPALDAPTARRRLVLRRELGFSETAPIWIYPGDLEHGGGAQCALQGFAAWKNRDAVLVMACREKTARAAEERTRLESQARRWGLTSRVRFFGETTRIHDLLAVSDFVVMANRTAHAKMDYPLVVLEAMSLGRLVVVGEATPSAELAEEGGALAVPAQGEALAEAIDRIDRDPSTKHAIERRAHELVATRFSPSRIAASYELLYEEVLA
ncbi:MAG TPA: glycosyltransferase family 4 protein [Polyangiales bacterium]|nr:glycosyltransferase family 4 protein [Polyangiales bacterium]